MFNEYGNLDNDAEAKVEAAAEEAWCGILPLAFAARPIEMRALEQCLFLALSVRFAEFRLRQGLDKAKLERSHRETVRKTEPLRVEGDLETDWGEECNECGKVIPVVSGGGLCNKHHLESCSLFDGAKD